MKSGGFLSIKTKKSLAMFLDSYQYFVPLSWEGDMKAPLLYIIDLLLYAHVQVYSQLQLTHVSKVVTRLSEHCHIVMTTLAILVGCCLCIHFIPRVRALW